MAQVDLEEEHREFWDDLQREATASGEPAHAAFFTIYSRVAAENGDCNDLLYSPVRKEGRGGYQVDGYALDAEHAELHLAVSDFRQDPELESLNAGQLEASMQRIRNFCELAANSEFINSLEEASPAFEAAHVIYSRAAAFRRIRVILFSNARLAARRKPEDIGEVNGKAVVFNVFDFSRFSHIQRSYGNADPIEIDIVELAGKALPCLPAHEGADDYASYLIAMPANLLARIYSLYGARLLEQNVRTFLQAKTKVNRGIIDTIKSAPEMFFAYNNGISATASGIDTVRLSEGAIGIKSVRDLQIVNGGQTTASILYARDQSKADLGKVYVQMKLSVVRPDRVETIVPKISRFANTQNRVSEADFFSSHPFHLEMEKISRRLSPPARAGSLTAFKWFYERARGQYKDQRTRGTGAERRKFELAFPKEQVFDKTDLAKYQMTFECKPQVVSDGAQKCFLEFAKHVDKAWVESSASFNDEYFKTLVARAIVFRWLDKAIGKSAWYQSDRGYKAQIVTYTISKLLSYIRTSKNRELNLQVIWNRQEVPEELQKFLEQLAPQIAVTIKDAPANMKNIGEYCKTQACWSAVDRATHKMNVDLSRLLITKEEDSQKRKDGVAVGLIDREIAFDKIMVRVAADTASIHHFAVANRILSSMSNMALGKISRGNFSLSANERTALKRLFEQMKERGYDFPPG